MAEYFGTPGNDILYCTGGNAVIGLAGNDILNSTPGTGLSDQVLVGGLGNDTYNAKGYTSTVILEAGSSYDVLNTQINLYGNTYMYTVGNKHLLMGDYNTNCLIMIVDAHQRPIEQISFLGGESLSFALFTKIPNVSQYSSPIAKYIYDLGETYSSYKYQPLYLGVVPPPVVPPPVVPPPVQPPAQPDNNQLISTAKNLYFDESQYLINKTAAINVESPGWTPEITLQVITQAGFTPWDHYRKYGAFEKDAHGDLGIDPSMNFDTSAYYAAKQAQCQEQGQFFNIDALAQIFKSSGTDPISHYALYGQGEGISITAVGVQQLASMEPNSA